MITREVDIKLTPNELAHELWEMDSKQQAEFFSIFGEIVKENGGYGVMQLDYISFENGIYPHGARVIQHLADALAENKKNI